MDLILHHTLRPGLKIKPPEAIHSLHVLPFVGLPDPLVCNALRLNGCTIEAVSNTMCVHIWTWDWGSPCKWRNHVKSELSVLQGFFLALMSAHKPLSTFGACFTSSWHWCYCYFVQWPSASIKKQQQQQNWLVARLGLIIGSSDIGTSQYLSCLDIYLFLCIYWTGVYWNLEFDPLCNIGHLMVIIIVHSIV